MAVTTMAFQFLESLLIAASEDIGQAISDSENDFDFDFEPYHINLEDNCDPEDSDLDLDVFNIEC